MSDLVRYRSVVEDSARWEGFPFRADDIVISSPAKSGTTWMQTLCAMLLFDGLEFGRPLADISPWLDMQTNNRAEVVASLEAQEHRRFIKTHTPLDGVPFAEGVTYVCVARDPRDVALSFQHHWANLDVDAFMAARARAVGLGDLEELGSPPALPEDRLERFWLWMDADAGRFVGPTLADVLHHVETFWHRRHHPQVFLFHYSDLLADLPGQLRRLANALSIDLADERVEQLAAAATFDRMRQRADELVPDVGNRIWRSNQAFFHRGYDGQWRELLDDEGLRRYERRVAKLVTAHIAAWAHTGWSRLDTASVSRGSIDCRCGLANCGGDPAGRDDTSAHGEDRSVPSGSCRPGPADQMIHHEGALERPAGIAHAEQYVIRGGKEGYERLLLLSRDRWPDTAALFDRTGLAPGMRCIDLGCGGGEVTMEIARLVAPEGSVTGVDMDEIKLDLARQAAAARGLGNVEFRLSNVRDWDEPGGYDVVYSRFLLQHLSQPVDVLRRMWAGVRPGGVLIVEDADHDGWCCHPPNEGFGFFVRTLRQVLQRRGGDHAMGRKLYACFLAAGIPRPQVAVVQSVWIEGEEKTLAWGTLEATREAIVSEGVASEHEVMAALAAVQDFTADPHTLICGPRDFQLWSRRQRS